MPPRMRDYGSVSDAQRLADFDFLLPADLIAQQAASDRSASRLLHLDLASGATAHHRFRDLPELLRPGDLLVINDTRVFPARLLGHRLPGGGAAECFLIRRLEEPDGSVPVDGSECWLSLVHPGQRLREGSRMVFERTGVTIEGEVLGRHHHGRRSVRLRCTDGRPLSEAIDAVGHVPLPPYIRREDEQADCERYQTVYARTRGSVAAPTAGLHFTPALLDTLAGRGVPHVAITLHVGYGTFQPVRVDDVDAHHMEGEQYRVRPEAAEAITRAKQAGGRVIAVGTTSTRTLESLDVSDDGTVHPNEGETALFIRPGHRFRVVDGLVTNFHLPKSSLLMLVSALAGRERVLAAYATAVASRYRFYSYGDAMLVL